MNGQLKSIFTIFRAYPNGAHSLVSTPIFIFLLFTCIAVIGGCSQKPAGYFDDPSLYTVLANQEKIQ